MTVRIREARPTDAEAVAALAAEFHDYLRSLGDAFPFHFDAESYRRDGFGERPAFQGVVAVDDDVVVGYLLHHPGYDTDASRRLLHVVDLFVQPDRRRRGVGRALMQAAADAARSSGATELVWTVYRANAAAFAFYERLGARRSFGVELMAISAASLPAV